LIVPSKIFVFGDLTVRTSNSPTGKVSWWYHVAPIIRSEDSNLWVLDPAVHPDAPILLNSWLGAMTNNITSLRMSACSSFTYGPNDSCLNSTPATQAGAQADEKENFLGSEWDRQVELHRDPVRVLGKFPPWINSSTV
jgi:hypothetical protein